MKKHFALALTAISLASAVAASEVPAPLARWTVSGESTFTATGTTDGYTANSRTLLIENSTYLYRMGLGQLLPYIWVGDYDLTITATDANGNAATKAVKARYEPTLVGLASGSAGKVKMPALTTSFRDTQGREAITSEVITVEGAPLSGQIEIMASVKAGSASVVVNGVTLQAGDTNVSVGTVDFTATGGRLALPAHPAEAATGNSTVLLTPVASGAASVQAELEYWQAKMTVTAPEAAQSQAISKVAVDLALASGAGCTATGSESTAKAGNVIDSPKCHVVWTSAPAGLAANGLGLRGRLTAPDPAQNGSYALYVYDHEGTGHMLDSGAFSLTVTPSAGSIAFGLDRAVNATIAGADPIELALVQSKGTTCTAAMTASAAAALTAGGKIGCLIEWTVLPDGVTQDANRTTPLIKGTPTSAAVTNVAWNTSVVLEDETPVLVDAGSASLPIAAPIAPVVTVSGTGLKDIGGGIYLSGVYDTSLRVTASASNTDFDLAIAKNGTSIVAETVSKAQNKDTSRTVTRSIDHPAAAAWATVPYVVSVGYKALPAVTTEKTFRVVTPPNTDVASVGIATSATNVLDTGTVSVNIAIKSSRADGAYDSGTMGMWRVRLVRWLSNSSTEPLSEYQALDGTGAATMSLDLKTVSNVGQVLRVAAQAQLVSEYDSYQVTKSSSPISLTVLPGKPIAVRLEAGETEGPAPFRAKLSVTPENRDLNAAIGAVVWETSSDAGETWTRAGEARTFYRPTLSAGEYKIRARTINKHSAEEYQTDPVSVVSYLTPSVTVAGPSELIAGQTGTYTATVYSGYAELADDDVVVEWQVNKQPWQPGGKTLALATTSADSYTISVRARAANAPPTDRRAWAEERARLKVFAVEGPRVRLSGPTRAEVGYERVWTADVTSPYRDMAVTIDGKWILPDGSEVAGKTLTWAPSANDLTKGQVALIYRASIAGVTSAVTEVSHQIALWQYVWPSWGFTIKRDTEFAPATVTLDVKPVGYSQSITDLGSLTYTWAVAEGVSVLETKGTAQTVKIPDAGEYPITVTIQNDRGHKTVLVENVKALIPPAIMADITARPDNDYNRAPVKFTLRANVAPGHPFDRVEDYRWSVNDIDVVNGRSGTLTLTDPGDYTLKIHGQSTLGYGYQKSMAITVVPNKVPVCRITVSERSTSYTFKGDCADPDGRVMAYTWKLNDAALSTSASRLTVSKVDGAPVVELIATDDAGGQSVMARWPALTQ
ncbi:MAG: hypothetical protein HQL38_03395 [Alphaproteobacteria bacterium]|nr:hypothetical protein [Alphaproteobacteria bacterium]